MITSAQFENYDNGTIVALNDDVIPFNTFDTEVDVSMEESERAPDWGIWPAYTSLGKRLFHVEGDLFGLNSADYIATRIQLIKCLTPSQRRKPIGKLTVQFSGMSEAVWAECTIDGWPELPMEGLSPARTRFLINWKSFDPRLYGATLNSKVADTPVITTGRSYPKAYNFIYADATATNLVLTNAGNVETPPVVVITGPVTGPQLTLFNPNGSVSSVTMEGLIIADGETVTVDFGARTAVSSTGADVYSFVAGSDWWTLKTGDNTVRFLAFSASAPSQAEFRWYNAYML